jgi:hypothetical protein
MPKFCCMHAFDTVAEFGGYATHLIVEDDGEVHEFSVRPASCLDPHSLITPLRGANRIVWVGVGVGAGSGSGVGVGVGVGVGTGSVGVVVSSLAERLRIAAISASVRIRVSGTLFS